MGRLVLWDIDGTLVRAGQVAADVFSLAVEHAVGRHPGAHGVRMGGKTDPQIALEILASMGIDTGDDHLPLVLGRLEAELAKAVELMREAGTVLPGVRDVLARLHDEPGLVQTVLTGNTAANAATKLAAFDLDRWLDLEIGAFGSDNPDRLALVPVALARAGGRFRPDEVWVVGDTVHDLACARAGGGRCALVRTGARPYELDGVDADAVLDDLSDVESVVKLLTS
ncbi:MAG TPA: haloacid dehalogenase-like hydrolase [Acidimicrobiales bacterium]|nr:haloacid dehalogenase-like hydrolase [Acidimicrobiales bacterium]